MKQNILSILAVFAALLFSACNLAFDFSGIQQKKTVEDDSTPTPEQKSGQEIQSMEQLFDPDVFNAQRAAWEAEHPSRYSFYQGHSGGDVYLSTVITVIDNIPDTMVLPDKDETDSLLRCSTISELYGKIDTVWNELRYTDALFLIKYDDQRRYPKFIEIKNINDSGYDYRVYIVVAYDKEVIIVDSSGDDNIPSSSGTIIDLSDIHWW
ncbi:MAG: hypothetical protein LBB98_08345 [Treponema sp.]|nr:hypothetical protein [Treponema sp.]